IDATAGVMRLLLERARIRAHVDRSGPEQYAQPVNASSLPMHNLPANLPPLIGREVELAELGPLVSQGQARLVTLTGPGGCGKTRLALELAEPAEAAESFSDGVWFIDLATLAEPGLVPHAVASQLGLREEPGLPMVETLLGTLRSRSMLLLIDNCEHLVEACATLCETLLGVCPALRILATSRERLGVTNEVLRQVAPLAVPDAEQLPEPTAIAEYAGVRLFVERARATHADLRLTPHTWQVVGQICARLDGIPLAIELAAARLRVLGPEQILERLDDSLHLLSGGRRTAPPRQQTLIATLEWSHALLTHLEQVVFRRMAVFAGGCDLSAAETVCAGAGTSSSDVLEGLARLADKSLVQVESTPSGARYRCLAPILQYARERLIDSGEHDAVRDRHLHYWATAVLDADVRMRSSRTEWSHNMRDLERLEKERDNIRAALRWAIANRNIELGLQVAAALSTPSYVWGVYAESRQLLVDLLEIPGALDLPSAAVALGSAGGLAFYQDDYSTARTLLEQSRARWVGRADIERLPDTLNSLSMTVLRHGDKLGARRLLAEARALELQHGLRFSEAMTLGNLATVEYADKDYIGATRLLEESCAIWHNIDNHFGLALALTGLGFVAHARGDQPTARSFFEESLDVLRDMDAPPQLARALAGLGRVALSEGDARAAREHFQASLRLLRECGQRLGVARCLSALAAVAAVEHQTEHALRLVGAARAACARLGVLESGGGSGVLEQAIDSARRQVGAHAAEALIRQGEAMDFEQAVATALAVKPVGDSTLDAETNPLSRREREVAALLAEGFSNRQIAERLVIAEKTAALHVEHILAKLGVRSRWQAADWVRRQRELNAMSIP
ncbi:MAG TPA: tetratricopeptide repeat protein, partial [Chloroflexota bacterium]